MSSAAQRYDPPDERELVLEAKAGRPGAQEALAQQFRQPAFVFALQLLGNREDALDVTQDALMRFFGALERFDASRPVLPWLRRIVHNRARDLQRRNKVRRADSIDTGGVEGEPLEFPSPNRGPTQIVEGSEVRASVWECLGRLSEAQREILVLRDYQDLSYDEIAKTLDVPIGTVMSRLHRARKQLRKVVLEHRSELALTQREASA